MYQAPTNLRLLLAFFITSALLSANACGGSSHPARSEGDSDEKPLTPTDKGLAAYIASKGGIESLKGEQDQKAERSVPLHFEKIDADHAVKLDGVLAEWSPLTTLSEVIQAGSSGHAAAAATASMRVGLEYDDTNLYVGGEVTDDSFVRTSSFKPEEDHASLLLVFPTASGGFTAYELGFFAGKPGEFAGTVKFLGGARKSGHVDGAKIVEAPGARGYSFEAQIPWNSIPEARQVRVGLRGVVRYLDAAGAGGARAIIATSKGELSAPASLPWLPTEPESALIEQILAPKDLANTPPSFDLLADIAGDGMKERVAVWGPFLTITGPRFMAGSFFYRAVDGEIEKVEARELTGRGKDDLVVHRKWEASGATHETVEVLSAIGNREPTTTFSHEIAIASDGHKVSNSVRLASKQIELSIEPASAWDASSFHETVGPDGEAVLLPWEGVKSQTFRFDGAHFVKQHEVTQPGAVHVREVSAAPLSESPQEPVAPRSPSVSSQRDLSESLIALFRKERAVPADVRPRFDAKLDLGGDKTLERVLLIGKDLVVVGPGFKGGTAFAYFALAQFKDAGDIREVNARELTGDGTSVIVVRGVRRQSEGHGAPVTTELMLVYKLEGESLERVFTLETSREQAGHSVQSSVQFVPAKSGRGFDIEVRPGRASGWSEQTYPWRQDAPGNAIEPLLLPWGGASAVRYSWNGARFSR